MISKTNTRFKKSITSVHQIDRHELVDTLALNGLTVVDSCEMADISRGAYYKQKNLKENPQLNSYQKSDEEVKKAILEIYQGLFRTYSKRKMKIVLQVRYGLQVSVRRVARLMRELNLKPNTTRAKRKSNTAILKKSSKRIDYLVRNFNADSVNKK